MAEFKKIDPRDISDNVFKAIGDEWMLITAVNSKNKVNTMTASWGGLGVLWNKPVCFCFVRPQRYTNEFIRDSQRLTLSVLDATNREALKICGTKSGRDCDKISEAGLDIINSCGIAYFEQSRLVIVAKKIYVDRLDENSFVDRVLVDKNYPMRDFHDVYVCEIEEVMIKD